MAPKQLLLEGPAIEPLLEKVWAEHGTDVRIVRAERVRVGGVAGFFAREQFEVTVEVPDPVEPARTTAAPPAAAPRAAAPAAPAAAPSGLEALLAAAEQAETGRPAAAAARPAGRPAARPAAPRTAAPRTAAPMAPPAAPAATTTTDFDAIFGSVTAGLPAPAPAALRQRPAPAPAAEDDDDPWVDGPPDDAAPPQRRPLRGRLTAPAPAEDADPPLADSTRSGLEELLAAAHSARAPQAPARHEDDDAPAAAAPPRMTVLPETPLAGGAADAAGRSDQDDAAAAWAPPWEAAAPFESAADLTDDLADDRAAARVAGPATGAGQPVLRPEHLSALLADHLAEQAQAEAAVLAAEAPPAPVLREGHDQQDRLDQHDHRDDAADRAAGLGSGLAVVATPPAARPARVGRSFAPVPSAQPEAPAYSFERSAVLRLPETAPHAQPAPLLATARPGAPHVVTSLGAAVDAPPAAGPGHDPDHRHDQHHDHRYDEAHHDGGRRARRGWSDGPPLDHHLPERLAALGVPAAWLWDLPLERSAALRELSLRMASAAAAAAPRRHRPAPVAEPVVVVLADLEDALPVAHHLATGMGLDVEGVVVMGRRAPGVAPSHCLPSRQDVAEEVGAARAERRALVVVLPAPVGAAPPARAAVADALGHLDPDEVWAVVDATRRLDDTAAWLAAVAGDRGVDALALTNTEVTSAPAAALALPAPVVLVGDRPASPEGWVSMLAARLAEQDLR